MFVVVTFQERSRALPRPLRRLFGGGIAARACACCGNAYWLVSQALSPGEQPDWPGIARICGRIGRKLVLPRGSHPPAGYGLRRCPPEEFCGALALAAAAQVLEALGGDAAGAQLGLIDPDALFPAQAPPLAEGCAAVRVYTRRWDRYEAAAQRAMQRGGTLLRAETREALSGSTLCAAPSAAGQMALPCPVIAAEGSRIRGRPTVDRLELALPPEMAAQTPPGVRPEDFFGAIALCGERGLPFPVRVGRCRMDGLLTELAAFSAVCRRRAQRI